MDVRFTDGTTSIGHALNIIQERTQRFAIHNSSSVAYILIRYSIVECPQKIVFMFSTSSTAKSVSMSTSLDDAKANEVVPSSAAFQEIISIDAIKWDTVQDWMFWFSNTSDKPDNLNNLVQSRFYQWLHSLTFARWVVKNDHTIGVTFDRQKIYDQIMPHRGWITPQHRVHVTESLLMRSKTLQSKRISVYTQLDIK